MASISYLASVRLWPQADPKLLVLGCPGLVSASDPKRTLRSLTVEADSAMQMLVAFDKKSLFVWADPAILASGLLSVVIEVTSKSTLAPSASSTMGEMKIIRACVTSKSAIFILSTLTIILSGCTAVYTDHLLFDPQTCHKNGISIDIYYTAPKLSYTTVAKIEAIKKRGRGASWEDVKVALCREAYALDLDVDGLIGIQEASVSTDTTLGPIGSGGESEKLTAIAIHYDETVE